MIRLRSPPSASVEGQHLKLLKTSTERTDVLSNPFQAKSLVKKAKIVIRQEFRHGKAKDIHTIAAFVLVAKKFRSSRVDVLDTDYNNILVVCQTSSTIRGRGRVTSTESSSINPNHDCFLLLSTLWFSPYIESQAVFGKGVSSLS